MKFEKIESFIFRRNSMERWRRRISLLCLLMVLGGNCPCSALLDPVSWTIVGSGVGLAGMYASYEFFKCKMTECCNAQWIQANITGLQKVMNLKLHGQHLVKQIVIKALKSHFRRVNPSKALVLSFHGWTGGGKNFVSQMIAEHIFDKGMRSHFVHLFVATLHFPHKDRLVEYKDNLANWIRGNISLCERSLFIFDEMDKMPFGLIDSIKPFIDYHEQINNQNFRRAIFIFLSNTGGSDITKISMGAWREGKARESITVKDMEVLISQGAFNEEGGLQHSYIIEKHLIDFYIPFLPLEESHVKLCIREEMRSRNLPMRTDLVDRVAEQLAFYPDRVYLYSKSGCKQVAQKLDLVIEDDLSD